MERIAAPLPLEWNLRIAEAVPVEMRRSEIPLSDSAAYSYGSCSVDACVRVRTTENSVLCRAHELAYAASGSAREPHVWAMSGQPISVASVKDAKRRTGAGALGAFLPELAGTTTVGNELRYALHARAMRGVATHNGAFNVVARTLNDHGVGSVLELIDGGEAYDAIVAAIKPKAGRGVAILRDAIEHCASLAGVQQPKVNIGRAVSGSDAYLAFSDVPQPWLEPVVRRWSEYRANLEIAQPQTIAQQVRAVIRWSVWCDEVGVKTPGDIDRERMLAYVAYVNKDLKKSDGTQFSDVYRRHLLSSVSLFLEACRANDWLRISQQAVFRKGELPSRSESQPNFLDARHVATLRDPENLASIANLDHRLIIAVMIDTGMRAKHACELTRTCIRQVTQDDDSWQLTYLDTKSGSGRGKPVVVPIPRYLALDIAEHATRKRAEGGSSKYLFSAKTKSGRISQPTVNKTLKEYAARLDLREVDGSPVNVTPHRFRHSFGTRLAEAGVPLQVIQKLMGHSSLKMTEVYAHISDRRIREEWNKANNLVNINGDTVGVIDGDDADFMFMRDRVKYATQALPIGACGLPSNTTCPHANACLTCESFCASRRDVPALLDQRERHVQIVAAAKERGQLRIVEINQGPIDSIDRIVAKLENEEVK